MNKSEDVVQEVNKATYRSYIAVAAMEHLALTEYQVSRREVGREATHPITHVDTLRKCYHVRQKLQSVKTQISQDKKMVSVDRVLLQDLSQAAVGRLLDGIEGKVHVVISKLDELEENVNKVQEETGSAIVNVPSLDSDAIIKTTSRKGYRLDIDEDDDDDNNTNQEAVKQTDDQSNQAQSVATLQQQRLLWKKINLQPNAAKNKLSFKDFEDYDEQMQSRPVVNSKDFHIVDKSLGDWQLISDVFCNLSLNNKSKTSSMPADAGFTSVFGGVVETIDKLEYKKVVRPPAQKPTPTNTPKASTPTAATPLAASSKESIAPINLGQGGFGSFETKSDSATKTTSSALSFGEKVGTKSKFDSSSTPSEFGANTASTSDSKARSMSIDEQYVAKVMALYQKHNPSKLEEIPQLINKYGHEELYIKLCKKYNEEPVKIEDNKKSRTSNPFSTSASANTSPAPSLFGRNRSESVEESKSSTQTGFGASATTAFAASATPSTSGFGGFGGFGAASSSSAPPKTIITATSSIADIEKRVREIYAQHNPDKLGEIPKIMRKYEGKEFEMLQKLEAKYPDNASANSTATPTKASTGFGGPPQLTPGFGASTPLSATKTPTLTPGFGSSAASSSLFKPSATTTPIATTGFGASTTPTPFGGSAGTSSLFNKGPAQASTTNPFQTQATTPSSSFGGAAASTTPTWGNNSSVGAFGQPASSSGFGSNAFGQSGNTNNSFEAKVLDIYQKHNPTKIGEIPSIMEKYRGKELELIARLEAKYKVNSGGASGGFGTPAQPSLFSGGGQATPTPFAASSTTPSTPFSGGGGGGTSLFGRPAQGATPFANANASTAGATSGWGSTNPATSLFGNKPSTGFGGGFR